VAKKKLRVLVLYGGEAATNPRNELMAWLARDSLNVKAKLVAEDAPHSKGAVDDRVDEAIAEADKAIALLTPDARSPYGAPNVIDEIGRWRGAKGKETICIVRQDGVPVYSNHGGIVYVGFKERVKDAFDGIREFLLDAPSTSRKKPTTTGDASGKKDFVVDSNANTALINGRRFLTSKIEDVQGRLTLIADKLDGAGEAALRDLSKRHGEVEIAYGNTAVSVNIEDVRITHGQSVLATLVCRVSERRSGTMFEASLGIGGGKSLSADDIAMMRATRILFNDPPESKQSHSFDSVEMFIKGGMHGAMEITESPVPRLLEGLPRDERATWEAVRLALIVHLKMSGTVEHIEKLRLTVRGGRLVKIEFRGRRAKPYVNADAFVIDVERKVNF
jgi:predicted nucleotide-binding protein